MISAIGLDNALAQRLAPSELIVQSATLAITARVHEIEQISMAMVMKVLGCRIMDDPGVMHGESGSPTIRAYTIPANFKGRSIHRTSQYLSNLRPTWLKFPIGLKLKR